MATSARNQRAESQQAEEARQRSLEQIGNAKQLALALIMFADANNGRVPRRFDETRAYLPGNSPLAQVADAQFEIVYSGRWTDLTNAASAILIRERQPRTAPDGQLTKAYAFADGHAEIHTATNGDFDAWEKAHQALPGLSR
jgi:hypothetical protein